MSVCIERMTQMSSMQAPTSGYSSLTSMPLAPDLRTEKVEPTSAPTSLVPVAIDAGGLPPWCYVSIGLGSNVSTCDGPPFMNRKMTRLARAGKWGGFGAIGLADASARAD